MSTFAALICSGVVIISTPQPTAWIPLLDVNEHNGTIQFIRGGHKTSSGGKTLMPHYLEKERDEATSHSRQDASNATNVAEGHPDSWYVFAKDEDLPQGEVVTAEMEMGDVVLLGNLVPVRQTTRRSLAARIVAFV